MTTSLTSAASNVSALAVIVAFVIGGAVGLGSGWLATVIERHERLEAEEKEEREEYEREVAALAEKARAEEADEIPTPEPWINERYGWTWLEKYLSPALGAVSFALFTYHQGVALALAIHLLWMAIFIHIIAFDLKHRLILNIVTYPSILVALALASVTPGLTIVSALLGAVLVSLFFLIQNIVSRGSIGLGDAKLGALIGATCGLGPSFDINHLGALYAVIYGVLLGGVVALVLLATRVRGLKDPIPYGPFLCAGAAFILYQGS